MILLHRTGLGKAMRKLWNKWSIPFPMYKKYDIIVSLNSEYGTTVAKLAYDFNISTIILTSGLKNTDKIFLTYQSIPKNTIPIQQVEILILEHF